MLHKQGKHAEAEAVLERVAARGRELADKAKKLSRSEAVLEALIRLINNPPLE